MVLVEMLEVEGIHTAPFRACIADISRELSVAAFAQREIFDNVQVLQLGPKVSLRGVIYMDLDRYETAFKQKLGGQLRRHARNEGHSSSHKKQEKCGFIPLRAKVHLIQRLGGIEQPCGAEWRGLGRGLCLIRHQPLVFPRGKRA